MIKNIVLKALNDIKEQVAKDDPHGWDNGIYKEIRTLQADKRGDVGELCIVRLLQKIGITNVKHTSATNPEDKHWDIVAEGITIEVKTATLGTRNKTFQHENLEKERRLDLIILLDIAPNDVYITCLPKHEIDWKKLHNRRTGISYKMDLSLKRVQDNRIVRTNDFKQAYESAVDRIQQYKQKKRKVEDI